MYYKDHQDPIAKGHIQENAHTIRSHCYTLGIALDKVHCSIPLANLNGIQIRTIVKLENDVVVPNQQYMCAMH